jgi:hypothetical protein
MTPGLTKWPRVKCAFRDYLCCRKIATSFLIYHVANPEWEELVCCCTKHTPLLSDTTGVGYYEKITRREAMIYQILKE